jgi:hypothetical protein
LIQATRAEKLQRTKASLEAVTILVPNPEETTPARKEEVRFLVAIAVSFFRRANDFSNRLVQATRKLKANLGARPRPKKAKELPRTNQVDPRAETLKAAANPLKKQARKEETPNLRHRPRANRRLRTT